MKTFKKYLVFIIGLTLLGFGISFGIKSGFGNNPMSVFVTGVALHLQLSVGTCNMLLGLLQAGFGFVFERKNITFATLLVIFCGSCSIDLGNLLIPNSDVILIRVLYMILGIFAYCFGFSLEQYAECGLGNYDCFIFGLGKALNITDYAKIRWFCDGMFIVLGFLLGGVVGLGTVILVLFSGKLIIYLKSLITKFFMK